MKLTIKPMIQSILAVLFAVVLAFGLQVGTVNAANKSRQPTTPTQQPTEQATSPTIMPTSPTIMPTSPTIMPTSPTIIMPTLSPEFYEQVQKQAKEQQKAK